MSNEDWLPMGGIQFGIPLLHPKFEAISPTKWTFVVPVCMQCLPFALQLSLIRRACRCSGQLRNFPWRRLLLILDAHTCTDESKLTVPPNHSRTLTSLIAAAASSPITDSREHKRAGEVVEPGSQGESESCSDVSAEAEDFMNRSVKRG